MEKLTLTFTVILLVFAVSHVRADLPEHDAVAKGTVADLPESDPKAAVVTLQLPSEKPGSEPVEEIHFDPEEVESKPEKYDGETVPLTVVNFRPINRHFLTRPLIPFRHRKPCRHHHRMFRLWDRRFQQREIPFGDDMILASNDNDNDRTGLGAVAHGGERRMMPRWITIHHDHDEPRFVHMDGVHRHDEDEEEHEHHHHHHHHHHHEEEEEEEKRREGHGLALLREEGHHHHHHHDDEKEYKKSGFLKGIRKFLEHF